MLPAAAACRESPHVLASKQKPSLESQRFRSRPSHLPAPSLLEDAYCDAINDIHRERGTAPPDGRYALDVQSKPSRRSLAPWGMAAPPSFPKSIPL